MPTYSSSRFSSYRRLLAFAATAVLAATHGFAQAQYAGTYGGIIYTKVSVGGQTLESSVGAYLGTVSATGDLNLNSGAITGKVSATGAVTLDANILGITNATITGQRLTSDYGALVANDTTRYKLTGSTFTASSGGTGGGGTGGGTTTVTNTSFTNGSFEGGPNPGTSWVTLGAGSTQINGWTISAGNIDYIGTAWQSSDGSRSLDMSGSGVGAISQAFTTVAGQTYTVTFDLAGNPGYGTGTGSKQLTVSVDNSAKTSQTYSFDTTGHILSNMGWVSKTFSFVASGTSTTLTFTSLTAGVYGPALDNVKVNDSGGETSTTAGASGVTAASAPVSLTTYRNKVGQSFQFTVTGTTAGTVWGSDIYTDDSSVAAAAVHAGVLTAGQTKTVTITILAGQPAYSASTRNGVASKSWGAWTASFSFADAGSASTTTVTATAKPALATGFVASTQRLSLGSRLVFPVTLAGIGPFTYQWYLNGVLISGATANPYVLERATSASAGTYTVNVTNSIGSTLVTAGTLAIDSAGAPSITLQPLSKVVAPGDSFTLLVSAQGAGNAYQWYLNGNALAGEIQNAMVRNTVNSADAGNYTVRITNSAGSITSNAATVTISSSAPVLANLSVRTRVAANQAITAGFVASGSGKKRVLIRAVGPTLGEYGVAGTMVDPKITLYRAGTAVSTNDNWTGLSSAFTAVGAFALTAGSKDAAMLTDIDTNTSYSVEVSGANGGAGVVLVEVYDADTAPTSKLVNVSIRAQVGTGSDTLILGFVVAGAGNHTFLVRGSGPALTKYGVVGAVEDPNLALRDSNDRVLLTNDNWNLAEYQSEMALAANFVGAFALDQGSKDASSLALITNGVYSAQINSTDGGLGEALVEIYDVP